MCAIGRSVASCTWPHGAALMIFHTLPIGHNHSLSNLEEFARTVNLFEVEDLRVGRPTKSIEWSRRRRGRCRL